MALRLANTGRSRTYPSLVWVLALTSLLWAYWTTLADSAERWSHDENYSHGFLVPVFALALLWGRRERWDYAAMRPTWWGLPILGAGIALRLAGAYFHFIWLDAIGLLPCLAGIALSLGGWAVWRWSWPALLFLAFMIPLPFRVGEAMADPLRRFAAVSSTFVLQTLGIPALSEGNRVLMNGAELDIVAACSGLRMLVIFFALSTAVALLIRKPLWEKGLIVVSAVPIALVANLARITTMGIIQATAGLESVDAGLRTVAGWAVYLFGEAARGGATSWRHPLHDVTGQLMMPLGLLLLWLELTYLNHLLVESAATRRAGQAHGARAKTRSAPGTRERSLSPAGGASS